MTTPQTQTLEEILLDNIGYDKGMGLYGIDEALTKINATMIPRTEHERELVQAYNETLEGLDQLETILTIAPAKANKYIAAWKKDVEEQKTNLERPSLKTAIQCPDCQQGYASTDKHNCPGRPS